MPERLVQDCLSYNSPQNNRGVNTQLLQVRRHQAAPRVLLEDSSAVSVDFTFLNLNVEIQLDFIMVLLAKCPRIVNLSLTPTR